MSSLNELQMAATTSRALCEDVELVEMDEITVARKKRGPSEILYETSPKRQRTTSAASPAAPARASTYLREPREDSTSEKQGLAGIIHSLVSKAVFSLEGDMELSSILDTFQSAVEKKINSGAIRIKKCEAGDWGIRDIDELKERLRSLDPTCKPSDDLMKLRSELMALQKEAAAWAQLAASKDKLVTVLTDEKVDGVEGAEKSPDGLPIERGSGLDVDKELTSINQGIQLEDMKLAQLHKNIDHATVKVNQASQKLMETWNEKFYCLLPDQKPIDMVKTLLGA